MDGRVPQQVAAVCCPGGAVCCPERAPGAGLRIERLEAIGQSRPPSVGWLWDVTIRAARVGRRATGVAVGGFAKLGMPDRPDFGTRGLSRAANEGLAVYTRVK
jgi:hypothetical protein